MKRKVPEIQYKPVTLPELIRIAGVDFTHAIVELDTGTRIGHEFDIKPIEFVSFAKSDIQQGGKRARVNALSNAKRAIDCQIDAILCALGHNVDKLPHYFTEFANKFSPDTAQLSLKLRVINALGLAPSKTVSEIRTLRNKTEHDYSLPTESAVKTAVEIAELFLAATERHLIDVWDFQITDTSRSRNGYLTGIVLHFSYAGKAIEVTFHPRDNAPRFRCMVRPSHIEHAILMRMCFGLEQEEEFKSALWMLLNRIGHKIPQNKIKVRWDV